MTTSKKAKNTVEYIAQFPKWKTQLEAAKNVLESTELKATIKWGAPCYTYNGTNLIGLAGFKNHCAVWFHKGSFLKDKAAAFKNAQLGKTKHLRQLRFCTNDTVDVQLLKSYILEAIELEKLGLTKEKRIPKTNVLNIPQELEETFELNSSFKIAFQNLTPSIQREYCNYIKEAKRDATKLKRIEKIIPLIMEGKGLHDKYKK